MIRKGSLTTYLSLATATLALSFASLGMNSCHASEPSGPPIDSRAVLNPENLVLKRCNLDLAGSEYQADIRQTHRGSLDQIDLTAWGEVIESETYQSTDDAFSVVNAGGESYQPPIPLIKYPMHIGDKWSWSGNLTTGPELHSTKADIETSSQDLTINGGTVHNVVRVDVTLSIDSGRPSAPATRKMTFWIAPNMGVVKRAFGDYSSREPLGD